MVPLPSDGLQFGRDDDLLSVCAMLREEDEVLINERSIPLVVFDVDSETIGSNAHETRTIYFEGRGGRVYRLRGEYGHNADLHRRSTRPPMLELRCEGEWRVVESCVNSIGLAEEQLILSDTRACDWLQGVSSDAR